MTILVITGGRNRTPTLAELEHLVDLIEAWEATAVRHGVCPRRRDDEGRLVGSTDVEVAEYLAARHAVPVEAWPADWKRYGRSAGPRRNRSMLDGTFEGELVPRERARVLVSFDGGVGTEDCRLAAYERGLPVVRIHAVAEPRPWNRHAGAAPGRAVYCGRGTPLGNPWPLELEPGQSRAEAWPEARDRFRRWLWPQLQRDSPPRRALLDVGPDDYLVCSCWPRHCHVEVLISAWRWLAEQRTGAQP